MADDQREKLKKKIEDVKVQLDQHKAAGKDLKLDPTCRQLRKTLKRAQRRLALLAAPTLQQRQARTEKLLELINKRLEELTKGAKKAIGNPYVHSLRKKLKSLNKRKKKLDRVARKAAEKTASAAPAQAAAPEPQAPTPAPEKK